MGYGEVAPGAMAAIAPAALSPSGQPRCLNEPFGGVVRESLGTERTALGSALDLMGGLRIMSRVMIRQNGAGWRHQT